MAAEVDEVVVGGGEVEEADEEVAVEEMEAIINPARNRLQHCGFYSNHPKTELDVFNLSMQFESRTTEYLGLTFTDYSRASE